MFDYLVYGVVTGLIARTWVDEALFADVRDWIEYTLLAVPVELLDGEWSEVSWWRRKLYTGLTCYYCVSHWVALIGFLLVQPAPLVGAGWTGYGVSFFVVVAVAVVFQDAFRWLRRTAIGG